MTAGPAAARERRRLVYALVANAATRIPAAFGILLFLPLARAGLGTETYAALLAALALGGAATFVFGGLGIAARRLIGEAHGAGDRGAQGDAFCSLLTVDLLLAALAVPAVLAWQLGHGVHGPLLAVALIPVLGATANLFDNVRAAYNEHYVTAIVQFIVQVALYGLGLGIAAFARDVVLAGVVIGAGGLIASLVTGVLLMRAHPALRVGRATKLRAVSVQAGGAGVADGLLMSGLAMAVVLVEARADPGTGAWFATLARLFQTFLAPVLLVLLPVASYLRIGWAGRDGAAQRRVLRATFAGGSAYGIAVAVAIAMAAHFYVGRILNLPSPQGPIAAAVFALFGAIVLYKSYTSVAFVLLDLRHLAIGSVAVVAASGAVAMMPAAIGTALAGYALVTAIGLAVLIADSVRRAVPVTQRREG